MFDFRAIVIPPFSDKGYYKPVYVCPTNVAYEGWGYQYPPSNRVKGDKIWIDFFVIVYAFLIFILNESWTMTRKNLGQHLLYLF